MTETLTSLLSEVRKRDADCHSDPVNELDPMMTTEFKDKPKTDAQVNEDITQKYLTPRKELSWDLLNEFSSIPNVTEIEKKRIYQALSGSQSLTGRTSIRFHRRGIKGEIDSYSEQFDRSLVQSQLSLAASSSFKRKYDPNSSSITGSISSIPFLPTSDVAKSQEQKADIAERHLHRDEHGLFDIPQGFDRGLKITDENEDESQENVKVTDLVSNEPIQKQENPIDTNADEEEVGLPEEELFEGDDNAFTEGTEEQELDKEIASIIPKGSVIRPPPSASIASGLGSRKRKEWAHMVKLDHKIENFDELVPNPARKWPFKLDTFQQEAIYHLEQGDSVFVAAHTSAGKTVVAEYAIAMAQRNMTKTIYTSPIKALSNQKFRDFKDSFDGMEVGVITGDVQINPDANCLIMTTEILRSMLYRGADALRDVEFVVFDEVHYVNDVDRGVVWEEVLIMLPPHIKVILLSATVPNTYEFASWVGRTRQKDIYVMSTPKRPVPLEIDIWARSKPIKVIDADRHFLEHGFSEHIRDLTLTKGAKQIADNNRSRGRGGFRGRGNGRGGRGGRGGRNDRGGRNTGVKRNNRFDGPNKNTWPTVVQYLRKHKLLPAVIFVFSKKKCAQYAESLSGVNFCNAKESSEIHMFMDQAVSRLKKEDRELPQIMKMRDMLERGIGVHHGGLLPIVKEVVEILFSRSLIKVLFATETFAMGLNLPTRTVIFSSLRKHDGTQFRYLLPGEFTQMSGRAGRRGIDTMGTVMVMTYNQPLDRMEFKQTTLGQPTKLSSQFRLTYTMILNLLRIEALKVEDMIKRSFGENSSQMVLPDQQMKVLQYEKELKQKHKVSMDADDYKLLENFFRAMDTYQETYSDLLAGELTGSYSRRRMLGNKLVVYKDRKGISYPAVTTPMFDDNGNVTCFTFATHESHHHHNEYNFVFNPKFGRKFIDRYFLHWPKTNSMRFLKVPCSSIEYVSSLEFTLSFREVRANHNKIPGKIGEELMNAISKRDTWSETNWKKSMLANAVEVVTEHEQQEKNIAIMLQNEKLWKLLEQDKGALYQKVCDRMTVVKRIENIKHSMSDESLNLLPEYQQRLEVLKSLGYVNPTELTVTLKGRVACEINNGWELVITELIFDNFLGDFTAEEIVALLSCFVYEGKHGNDSGGETKMSTPRLEKGKDKIRDIVSKLTGIYTDKRITMTAEEESFLESNRFGLVNTVYEWARGQSFKEIMESSNDSDESEGTIVRVITFLDEVCRQVRNAALIIGDSDLHSKMLNAQEKIKRDIVFCASLYL